MAALQTLDLLSKSLMRKSPEMGLTSQVYLVKISLWNFLPSQWGWDHCVGAWLTVLCDHCYNPYDGKDHSAKKGKFIKGQLVWKNDKSFKCTPTGGQKATKCNNKTGSHEDHHRKRRSRVTCGGQVHPSQQPQNDKLTLTLTLTAPEMTAQLVPYRVLVEKPSPHQLVRGDCMNQAFVVR